MSEIQIRPCEFGQHRAFKVVDKGEFDTIVQGNGTKHRPKKLAAQLPFKLVKGLPNRNRGLIWKFKYHFKPGLSFHQGK